MIPLNTPRPFAPNALWYMLLRALVVVLLLGLIASVFRFAADSPGSCSGALCGKFSGNRVAAFLYLYGAVLLVGAAVKFTSSTFVLTDKSINIRSGVFFQNSATIRFDRIQDVVTRRDPLLMMLGLTSVAIWTASPDQRVGKTKRPDGLVLLTSADAEGLKSYLSEPASTDATVAAAARPIGAALVADRLPVAGMIFALIVAGILVVCGIMLWGKGSVRTPAVANAVAAPAAPPADNTAPGRHSKRHVVASVATAQSVPSPYGLACAIRGAGSNGTPPCAELSEAQRCGHESDFRSEPTAEPAELTVVNRSDQQLKFYWLDRSGGRSLYAALPPGGQVKQQSHVGAHWLVSTDDGRCIGIFNATTTTIGVF
jgi:membrane protein YdbS with pleckstrin-like domain